MTTPPRFGFPAETIAFLSDLRADNDKAWFEAHRDRYESSYVAPAKAFVEAVAPALDALVPGIHAEPRVLGSIFRIHRDTRFSKDKTPYKDHLDLWFWEGARKAAVSGLFLRVAPDEVVVGSGAHGFDKAQLTAFRAAVADPAAGGALAELVSAIERDGHEVGGATYARTPKGFDVDATRERFLRHSALYAHEVLPPEAATDPTFAADVLVRWEAFLPLHRWLQEHVGGG